MDPRLPKRFEALIHAFYAQNPGDLKRIGNDAISDAATNNDSELAAISVISYALYKMLTKEHFTQSPRWPKISQSITSSLQKCLNAIESGNIAYFEKSMKSAIGQIKEIDDELSNYARNIYEKAKIKQASTAYAMGMSINQAAELTQANRSELQRYIGVTRIHDEHPSGKGIVQRLSILKNTLKDM